MEMTLTKHYCMSEGCGWKETSHRLLDGLNCPRCSGPLMSEKAEEKANELKYRHRAQCLVCNHIGTVIHANKEDYSEVSVCPKCNGAFVDTFKLCKYEKVQLVTEKESINGKLEEVFCKACDDYLKRPGAHAEHLAQIRQLSQVLIASKKQSVIPESEHLTEGDNEREFYHAFIQKGFTPKELCNLDYNERIFMIVNLDAGIKIKMPADSKSVNEIVKEIVKKIKESLGRMNKK